jgi:hypothetical protein
MWRVRVTIVTMETQQCVTYTLLSYMSQYKDIESVALQRNNTFLKYCQPQDAANNATRLPVVVDMQRWFSLHCCCFELLSATWTSSGLSAR